MQGYFAPLQKNKLPEDMPFVLLLLMEDLKNKGGNPGVYWPNYKKFKGLKGQRKNDDWRHCHLQKGMLVQGLFSIHLLKRVNIIM